MVAIHACNQLSEENQSYERPLHLIACLMVFMRKSTEIDTGHPLARRKRKVMTISGNYHHDRQTVY